jgi:hypothetical protein
VKAPARTRDRPRRPVAKIDVHAHYLPADYRQALIDNGQAQPDGFPVLPTWSPKAHLAMMDQVGIRTSLLSISSPGVTFGVDAASWARRVNETGAATVRRYRRASSSASIAWMRSGAPDARRSRAQGQTGCEKVERPRHKASRHPHADRHAIGNRGAPARTNDAPLRRATRRGGRSPRCG